MLLYVVLFCRKHKSSHLPDVTEDNGGIVRTQKNVSPSPARLRYGSGAYPLYDTWLFPVYAVPDTKAGAEQAGKVKPVPPAATRAFLAARSKRLFTDNH